MASPSTSYDTQRHRSAGHNIPRSKTPGPGSVPRKANAAEPSLPRRTRTPFPHEEDTRHHRRTTETSAMSHKDQGHGQYRAFARPPDESCGDPSLNCNEPKWTANSSSLHEKGHQRAWDEAGYDVDFQVRIWMIQEETRRIAAAREAERTRLVQEEVRRVQAKILLKREYERLRILEEMGFGREDDERERAKRQKAALDKVMANAWAIYERNWATIAASSEPLSFASIPWPTLTRPSGPSSITLPAISAFLLSDAHSPAQKPKERIKEALRRWHPDRFVRILRRVPLEERATVEETVGIVTRCLSELLSKYSD